MLIAAWTLTWLVAQAPPTVLVPHVPGDPRCADELVLAGALAARGLGVVTPTLSTTTARDRAALERAAGRAGAGLVATATSADGRLEITLTATSAATGTASATWPRSGRARTLDAALDQVWPEGGGALALPWVSPAVACRREGAPAPRLESDVAALLGLGPPSVRRAAEGRRAAVIAQLQGGELVERWSLQIGKARAPTARLVAQGPVTSLFGEQKVELWSVADGRALGAVQLGRHVAELIAIDDTHAVVLGEREVLGLDLAARRIAFRASLEQPFPERVITDDTLIVAGPGAILALDPRSGEPRWRVETSADLSIGPALWGERPVVAQGTEVVVLDPRTGSVVERVDLGAEISGLAAAVGGRLLALVGADRVAVLGGERPDAVTVPGLVWPPLVSLQDPARVLFWTRDRRRGGALTQLLVEGRATHRPVPVGGLVVGAHGTRGGAWVEVRGGDLVSLDPRGLVRTRTRLAPPARLLELREDAVLAQEGRGQVIVVSRGVPARQRIRRDASILQARWAAPGGVILVLTDDGNLAAFATRDSAAQAALLRRLAPRSSL